MSLMKSLTLKILILTAIISLACTTKVSEWVLLNVPANRYTLVYFYKNALGEAALKQNASIGREIETANIQFRSFEREELEKPYYGLYYGKRFLSRYDDAGELKGLTTSPMREKIALEIMKGKLCVLLYLTTGDRSKDENGMKIIQDALQSSPFKDVITVQKLDRSSTEEKHFVSMLLNVEDDLKTINEPMLFGIFGRFKALEPLLGKGITGENISLMINFLTADCSCLIKDNLPGTDILYTDNWENPTAALVNKILDENPSLQHF
jgi:hypothetical protein